MIDWRASKGKPPSVQGAALYRRLAAQASTLRAHLDALRMARKQIDSAEDEVYRREAVAVVRDVVRGFVLTRDALDRAIAESREHFELPRG